MSDVNPYEGIALSPEPTQQQSVPLSGNPYEQLATDNTPNPKEPTTPLQGFVDFANNLGNEAVVGTAPFLKAFAGAQMAVNPDMTFKEAQDQFNSQSMLQAQMGVEEYNKKYGSYVFPTMAGKTTEFLPFLGTTVAGSLAGRAAGAVAASALTGSRIGSAIGGGIALVAGMAGPQAATPEEFVTVPAMATLGGSVGAFVAAAVPSTFSMFYDQMEQQTPRVQAAAGAMASGLINGIGQVVGLGAAGKGLESGFKIALQTSFGKQWIGKQILNLAKTMAVTLPTGAAVTIADSLNRYINAKVSGHPELYSALRIEEDIKHTLSSMALATPGLVALGGAASVGGGMFVRQVTHIIDARTAKIEATVKAFEEKKAAALQAEQAAQAAQAAQQTTLQGGVQVTAKPEPPLPTFSSMKQAQAHYGDAIKNIEFKIDDLENQIQDALDHKQDATALEAKLEQANKERKAISKERKKVQLHMINVEIDRITAAMSSKYHISDTEPLHKEIIRAQKLLTGLITKSGLNKEQQGAFIEAIANVDSVKALVDHAIKKNNGAIEMTEGIASKIRKRIAILLSQNEIADASARVDKQLSKKAIAPVLRGKLKHTKFPGVQEQLDTIQKFWKDDAAAAEASAKLDDYNSKGTFDADVEAQGIIANSLFGKVRDEMTVEDINAIGDSVQQLKDTGKANRTAALAERSARREGMRSTLLSRIMGSETNIPQDTGGTPNKTLKEKGKTLLETFGTNWFPWEKVQKIITQRGGSNHNFDLFDPFKLLSEETEIIHKWQKRLNDILVNAVKDKTPTQIRVHVLEGNVKGFIGEYLAIKEMPDGTVIFTPVKMHRTRNEAIQLWLFLNDKEAVIQNRLRKGNGFTFPGEVPHGTSTYEIVHDYLAKDGISLKLAEGIQQFYGEFFDEMVDPYNVEKTGRRLDKNLTYGGTADTQTTRKGFYEGVVGMFRRSTARPGASIERTMNNNPVEIHAFNDKANNNIDQFAHAWAYRFFEGDAPAVMQHSDIVKPIRHFYGDGMVEVINQHINDLVAGRYKLYDAQSKVLGYMRKNAYTFMLAAKLAQYPKQLTGAINGLLAEVAPGETISTRAFMEGIAAFLVHPKQTIDLMNQSHVLQERGGLIDRDFVPNVSSAEIGVLTKEPTLQDMAAVLVKLGDTHASYLGGYPVLREVLKRTGDKKAAILAFERWFNSTQSSGTIDQQPALFRGNEINKMLTMFAQQPTVMTAMVVSDFRDAANAPNGPARTKAVRKAIRTLLVANASEVLYASLIPLMLLPFLKEDERNKELIKVFEKATLGPITGAAIAGPAISAMMAIGRVAILGTKEKNFKPGFIITDVIGDFIDLENRISNARQHGLTANDSIKMLRIVAKIYGIAAPHEIGGGLPLEAPLKFIDDVFIPAP